MQKHALFVSYINTNVKPDLIKFCAESIARVGFNTIQILVCFSELYNKDEKSLLIKNISFKIKEVEKKYPQTNINISLQSGPLLSKFDYLKIIIDMLEESDNKPSENDKILLMNGDDMILNYDPNFDKYDFIAGHNFITNIMTDNDTDKMNIDELITSIGVRMRNWDSIIDYGGSIIPYWFIKNYLYDFLEKERSIIYNYPIQTKKKLIICEKIDFLRELRHQDLFIPKDPFVFHRLWETTDIL